MRARAAKGRGEGPSGPAYDTRKSATMSDVDEDSDEPMMLARPRGTALATWPRASGALEKAAHARGKKRRRSSRASLSHEPDVASGGWFLRP